MFNDMVKLENVKGLKKDRKFMDLFCLTIHIIF